MMGFSNATIHPVKKGTCQLIKEAFLKRKPNHLPFPGGPVGWRFVLHLANLPKDPQVALLELDEIELESLLWMSDRQAFPWESETQPPREFRSSILRTLDPVAGGNNRGDHQEAGGPVPGTP